jgi:hypothetical protein
MDNDNTERASVLSLRCPATPRFTGDLVGCGSTDVTQPDHEGLCDCRACGMWFRASECHQPSGAALQVN